MHAPTLPKLKKTPKRILDLVHLLFASLWLGGFTIVLVCSIMLWTQTIDPVFGLATINFVQEVVKVCIPALMATGLLYGFATKWGFFSHGWVTAKWMLTITLVVSTALVPIHPLCLSAIVAGMIALLLFRSSSPTRKLKKRRNAHNHTKRN